MSKLEALRETRTKALADVGAILDEHGTILETRSLTTEEVTKREDATKRVSDLQDLIAAEEVREAEAAADLESRNAKLGNAAPVTGTPGAGTEPEVRTDAKRVKIVGEQKRERLSGNLRSIRVGAEPVTYSRANPQNSFHGDLLAAAWPATAGHAEAVGRLTRHQVEMDGIRRNATKTTEGRTLQSYDNETRRRAAQRTEKRDVSTGVSSLGDFAPPLYFLSKYAPFRTYGKTLISILKSAPLPETGMVFNLPKIVTPTEAENQTTSTQGAGENTTVSNRDMTSSYETGAVQTVIDNLLVSQQYLDRVGPGIDGDMIVHDDQTRQLNRVLNGYAWGALLGMAGNGAIAWNSSAAFNQGNIAEFKRQVHGAKAAIRRTDGVVAYPTHFISDADVWEQVEGSYDTNGRPYTTGDGASAFNPIAIGEDNGAPEGYTGFKFGGLPAFADESAWVYGGELDNIVVGSATAQSATLSTHAAVVGAFDIACYWMEGPPVVRVLPQPYAQTLTVLIQQYCYCALVPEYPGAVQVIYGTALADSTVTSY
jgi:hypothetical protein